MDTYLDNPWLVPFDGRFTVDQCPTAPEDEPDKKDYKKRLQKLVEHMGDLQHRLYASDTYSLLLVFQALDAAGKDSTIRAALSGVDPAGFQVYSFKQPSAEELDHDFLWRTAQRLPQRGRIGVFNRSYYEEVLVVRVHPNYLGAQRLPNMPDPDTLWEQRFESIRDHEKHLARNGTAIVKFWLNVSRDEQRRRFLSRIEEPEKNWKFSSGDVEESTHWDAYMSAYEAALNATSRPWAPWYAIPADDKRYMRLAVAQTIVDTLKRLHPEYPTVSDAQKGELKLMRKRLEQDQS